jgi:hypothetical protein
MDRFILSRQHEPRRPRPDRARPGPEPLGARVRLSRDAATTPDTKGSPNP